MYIQQRPEVRLFQFIQEIYGDQAAMTRVEVYVEALSGGAHGSPHLEATEVRVYAGAEQLLPDFGALAYWSNILAADPNVFGACTTHQARIGTLQEWLEDRRVYLEYGLDWPDVNEKVVSPLCFAMSDLRQIALHEMGDCDAFVATCPRCGEEGTLTVLRAFLVATGDDVETCAQLHAGGFDITPFLSEQQLQAQDLSIGDADVECGSCHESFTLDALRSEGQHEYGVDVWATIGARETVRAGSRRVAEMIARRAFEQRPVYDCNIEDIHAEVLRSGTKKG